MNNSYANRDCPPIMQDGRHVTDYRPSCEVHSSIRYHNNLTDSNQYRQFMMNNAEKIMDMERSHWSKVRSCNSCSFVHPDPNNNDTFWAAYRKHLYGSKTEPVANGPYSYKFA